MAKVSRRVRVRWKLLGAFAGAFTVVFVFIAIWVIRDAGQTAMEKVDLQLTAAGQGVARILNGDDFATLVATVPAVPDPANPTGLGYPDSPLFTDTAAQLFQLTDVLPESQPYTYFRDATDGKLYFAASAGYFSTPQSGTTFRQPVDEVAGLETQQRMAQGLIETTDEPPYSDTFGSWVSVYTPIYDSAGQGVGAVGVDYPLDYVRQVQRDARVSILSVLGVSYVVLMLVVLVLSTMLVRPLHRLTEATHRVAEGEYDLDVTSLVTSRFPDELSELGESFESMAAKVGAREQSLTKEVQRLRVQIDSTKRQESVQEIVETDFFADLAAKAAQLRARVHDDETPEDGGGATAPGAAAPGRITASVVDEEARRDPSAGSHIGDT